MNGKMARNDSIWYWCWVLLLSSIYGIESKLWDTCLSHVSEFIVPFSRLSHLVFHGRLVLSILMQGNIQYFLCMFCNYFIAFTLIFFVRCTTSGNSFSVTYIQLKMKDKTKRRKHAIHFNYILTTTTTSATTTTHHLLFSTLWFLLTIAIQYHFHISGPICQRQICARKRAITKCSDHYIISANRLWIVNLGMVPLDFSYFPCCFFFFFLFLFRFCLNDDERGINNEQWTNDKAKLKKVYSMGMCNDKRVVNRTTRNIWWYYEKKLSIMTHWRQRTNSTRFYSRSVSNRKWYSHVVETDDFIHCNEYKKLCNEKIV